MRIQGVIDRLEETYAVILLGEEEKRINWPQCFLPQGAKEGQILQFNLLIDYEATEKIEKELEEVWEKIINQEHPGS